MTRPNEPLSQAMEDYAKAIYKLQSVAEPVTTTDLARKMGTTPAAATKMIKHLAQHRLVDYIPYRGVRLTPAGERIALEIIRHHRLLELYLFQELGYGWDEVDAEADRLEHSISEEFEARIDKLLGHPTADPHNDPIPTPEGTVTARRGACLADAQPGETLVVLRVRDSDPAALRALAQLGLRLAATVTVRDRRDADGSLTLAIGGVTHTVRRETAAHVFVESAHPEDF